MNKTLENNIEVALDEIRPFLKNDGGDISLVSFDNNTVKVKVLKVKFQNLGENQAEAHFKWNHASGDYMPVAEVEQNLPWE